MKYWTLALAIGTLTISTHCRADFIEIFESKLNGSCTPAAVQKIGNKVAALFSEYGYTVEILATQHGIPQDHILWIGRAPSAEAWGKAHDQWRSSKEGAELAQEIANCSTTLKSSTHVSVQ